MSANTKSIFNFNSLINRSRLSATGYRLLRVCHERILQECKKIIYNLCTMRCRIRSVAFVLAAFVIIAAAAPARAEFVSTPDAGAFATNGTVSAITATTSTVYVGGTFSFVGPYTGNGAPISSATGIATSAFPVVTGAVTASVPDGSGGWYIGGDFTRVGSSARNRIAHILPSGVEDPAFSPNADGNINTLVLRGSTLYASGSFNVIGGQTRHFLAALSAVDGSVLSAFDPNPNSAVAAMVLSSDGSTLYVGGSFTTIGGQSRGRLAAVSTANGLATAFNPLTSTSAVTTLELSADNSTLYVALGYSSGGNIVDGFQVFSTSGSGARLSGYPVTSGSAFGIFIGGPALYALKLNPSGSKLYIGILETSNFGMGGIVSSGIMVLDTSTKAVTNFAPVFSANARVQSLAFSTDGSVLYAGGFFSTISGAKAGNLAAFNTADGSVVSTFDRGTTESVMTLSPSSDGSQLYAGGYFKSVGAQQRNDVFSYSTSNNVLNQFNPNLNGTVTSLALSPDGSSLYMGGAFTTVGGATYNRLAKVLTSDGSAVAAFNPNLNGAVNALALSADGSTIYAGGAFTTIGGATYNDIGAVSAIDGSAVSAFNPNLNGAVNSLILSLDGLHAYFGGAFTTIGGVTYNRLAEVSTSDGSAVSAFNPDVNGIVNALAVSSDGLKLYLGGQFTSVGGTAVTRFSAVNTTDGSRITSFAPVVTGASTFGINALVFSADESVIYATGRSRFTAIQGRNLLAGLHVSDATVTSFNASPATSFSTNNQAGTTLASISAIARSGRKIYIGGSFGPINNDARFQSFASFTEAGVTLSKTTASVVEGGATDSYTVVLDAPASTTVTVTVIPDSEATISPDTLTFTTLNWNVPQAVTISSPANLGRGDTRTGTITHSVVSADLAYNEISVASVAVTINDSTAAIAPTVVTLSASSITPIGPTLNGSISDTGGSNALSRGFSYGLTTNYGATTTESGSFTTGAFAAEITTLACDTPYHFQAYATNTAGTSTGSDLSFTTAACEVTPPVSNESHHSSSHGRTPAEPIIPPAPFIPTTFSGCDNRTTGYNSITGQSCANNSSISPQLPPATPAGNAGHTYNFGFIALKLGSKGTAVKELQRFLNDKMNLALTADGNFGTKTRAAVILFQKTNKLIPDGIVGTKTKGEMKGI